MLDALELVLLLSLSITLVFFSGVILSNILFSERERNYYFIYLGFMGISFLILFNFLLHFFYQFQN